MNKWLLTWNPAYSEWNEIDSDIEQIRSGSPINTRWSTGNTKAIEIGDEIFVLKQGEKPTGIFARGIASSTVFQDAKWDDKTKTANYAQFDIVELIDPASDPILDVSLLKSSIPSGNWSPLASGSKIKEENWDILSGIWKQVYESK